MPFFSKTCSQLQQLGTPPHSAVWVGFERTFFFRNPTFSGVFEKNNIRMIENVFMQYFFSSLAICWDRGKKLILNFLLIHMVCLMCADTSVVLVGLKTWKYGQNPFEWCPQELCATKPRSCGSLQSWVILSENHQFSRFENFEEIFSFRSKTCKDRYERLFDLRSS